MNIAEPVHPPAGRDRRWSCWRILLFGVMAYRALPVSDLPNVDFPTLLVTASLPGASPETMASSVATPLERQFSTIAGIDVDDLDQLARHDADHAAVRPRAATSTPPRRTCRRRSRRRRRCCRPTCRARRPSARSTPPTSRSCSSALTSPTLPLWTLDEYGETLLAQRISMVSGVAQVQVFGAQKYAVRIQLDPQRAGQPRHRHRRGRAGGPRRQRQPAHRRRCRAATSAFTVQATGQLTEAALYRPVIVAYRNGSPVRLEELGTRHRQRRERQDGVLVRRRRRRCSARSCSPSSASRAPTPSRWPTAVKALLPHASSSSCRRRSSCTSCSTAPSRSSASVNDVKFTLLLTLALVVLVIFLFLRNLSATVIPSLALPLSIVGTFAVMYLLGFSLDNLSLMALTLSVGFVVDDAIVMLENIVRHMEMGEPPLQAALDGLAARSASPSCR